jgi:phage portal protein BeeE
VTTGRPSRSWTSENRTHQGSYLAEHGEGAHLNAYGGKNDAIDHVMNCVRLYCDAASAAPWHLEKKGEKLRRPDEDASEGDIGPIALYNLLDSPNPYMDYEELVELLVIDLLLVGNAYWYKWRSNEAGQPLALYRLAPPYVKVLPGDIGSRWLRVQGAGLRAAQAA